MASTHCSTSAPLVAVLSSAARVPHVSVTWSIQCSGSLPSPIPWRRHPNGSTTAREEAGTTVEREEEATEVEGRTVEDTTRATSLALPGGTSLESVARAEIRGTSRADATAVGQQAGGVLMTTWTATAASWSVGADGGTQLDMRAWMQRSRSSR